MAFSWVVLVTGCSQESEQAAGGFQRPPTPVESSLVAGSLVTDQFTTVGTIEAGESITVTSEIDGIVTAIPFREGGRLQAGELIARLNDDQLKAYRGLSRHSFTVQNFNDGQAPIVIER